MYRFPVDAINKPWSHGQETDKSTCSRDNRTSRYGNSAFYALYRFLLPIKVPSNRRDSWSPQAPSFFSYIYIYTYKWEIQLREIHCWVFLPWRHYTSQWLQSRREEDISFLFQGIHQNGCEDDQTKLNSKKFIFGKIMFKMERILISVWILEISSIKILKLLHCTNIVARLHDEYCSVVAIFFGTFVAVLYGSCSALILFYLKRSLISILEMVMLSQN